MDLQERYEAIRTKFYLNMGKLEMIYFVCMIIYCTVCLTIVFYTKGHLPEVFELTSTKVIFMLMIIIGISVHFTMKALFQHVFKYKSFFIKTFAEFTDEECSVIKENVINIWREDPNPKKDPFLRTITSHLKLDMEHLS